MRTACLESPGWPRDCLLPAWAHQLQGQWVRELASSPLAQVAPFRGIGADTRPMVSTRQTGAYQTACDHNQQWQRTINAIIYNNTVQVSFSFSLLRLFTFTLFCWATWRGCDPVGKVGSRTFSQSPQLPCQPRSFTIRRGEKLQALPDQSHIFMKLKEDISKCMGGMKVQLVL